MYIEIFNIVIVYIFSFFITWNNIIKQQATENLYKKYCIYTSYNLKYYYIVKSLNVNIIDVPIIENTYYYLRNCLLLYYVVLNPYTILT